MSMRKIPTIWVTPVKFGDLIGLPDWKMPLNASASPIATFHHIDQ